MCLNNGERELQVKSKHAEMHFNGDDQNVCIQSLQQIENTVEAALHEHCNGFLNFW